MEVKKHILDKISTAESNNDCNVFVEELMSIYKSEKKLNSKLPTMILNAKTLKIAIGLTEHLKFTQEHLLRLETLFKSINQPLIP
jgi:ferritin-like metal-binding protein YciE